MKLEAVKLCREYWREVKSLALCIPTVKQWILRPDSKFLAFLAPGVGTQEGMALSFPRLNYIV